jgi:hypothetical protein
MGQSGIDRRRIAIQSPLKMCHRLVARRCLFAGVIVQMPLLMEQIWTRVEQQDLADNVLVNGVMIQMKPVQVNFFQHRLRRQMEREL